MLDTKTKDLKEQRLQISGMDIELWSGGAGRTILFLHPGDGFDPASPFLVALAEKFRVLAPFHPGFGSSDLPLNISTTDDLSYYYLDFLKALDLRDIIVVGISFGGWIAAEIAVKTTDRLSGLIFVDAVGVKFSDHTTRDIADIFSVPQFEQGRLIYNDPEAWSSDYSTSSEEELMRLARNHESYSLFGWSPTLHNPKLLQRLPRIDVPSHVIWGAEDRVVSPHYGRQFAKAIPNASFELIESAGHYPQMEQPELVVAAIEKFVDGLDRAC